MANPAFLFPPCFPLFSISFIQNSYHLVLNHIPRPKLGPENTDIAIMTVSEANGKRPERERTTPATVETSTTSGTEQKQEDSPVELIRTRNSPHIGLPVGSRHRASTVPALFHTVSQNGYGCNGYLGESNEIANEEARIPDYWTLNDKDPFEVAFDAGGADPMSPRSMKTVRKWLIVSVLSGAGLCL